MDLLQDYLKYSLALFAILDPLSAVPIFLSLTGEYSKQEKNATLRTTFLTIFFVLIVSSIVGLKILDVFSTNLNAFRIAGGLVLMQVAFGLLNAESTSQRHTDEEHQEALSKSTIGAVPLGIPLISGPGAITSVILKSEEMVTWQGKAVVYMAILTVSLISVLILKCSGFFGRLLGVTGINIVSRIMGLIVAAIAVQLIIGGINDIYPALKNV